MGNVVHFPNGKTEKTHQRGGRWSCICGSDVFHIHTYGIVECIHCKKQAVYAGALWINVEGVKPTPPPIGDHNELQHDQLGRDMNNPECE